MYRIACLLVSDKTHQRCRSNVDHRTQLNCCIEIYNRNIHSLDRLYTVWTWRCYSTCFPYRAYLNNVLGTLLHLWGATLSLRIPRRRYRYAMWLTCIQNDKSFWFSGWKSEIREVHVAPLKILTTAGIGKLWGCVIPEEARLETQRRASKFPSSGPRSSLSDQYNTI